MIDATFGFYKCFIYGPFRIFFALKRKKFVSFLFEFKKYLIFISFAFFDLYDLIFMDRFETKNF